jgi:UDP-N-acetylmuramate: L-alanyl-gamma-D-glutamyl-meso-diaminopimelate ligase
MGKKAQVAHNIDELVREVLQAAAPGDHLLCMSNGGFGGVHQRLLQGLQALQAPAQ